MIDLKAYNLYSFISALDEKAMTILEAIFKIQKEIWDPNVLVNAILNTF